MRLLLLLATSLVGTLVADPLYFVPRDKVNSVSCGSGEYECPNGCTCCVMQSGHWGCCPMPQAQCCSDKLHCCPKGATCGTGGTCTRDGETFKASRKSQAQQTQSEISRAQIDSDIVHKEVQVMAENKVCPGGTSTCPDGSTCCKLSSGKYGCCPMPNAVCCSDGVHCCPSGKTCDVAAGTCKSGNSVTEWFTKVEAQPVESKAVICPDGKSQCPDGSTCCKLSSGQYGCCPLPKAVCCSDGVHCCPSGRTCDVAAGTCNSGNSVTEWFTKVEAQPVETVVSKTVACPGGKQGCPDGNSCCLLKTGLYGCCPLPQAVCCLDRLHCCPSGYKCGTVSGTCSKADKTIPWFNKLKAFPLEAGTDQAVDEIIQEKNIPEDVEIVQQNVKCPDGQSECPSGNTCCHQKTGQYGCCPLPSAVCCEDKIHCCPNGYTCDPSAGTCNKGLKSLPWVLKEQARKSEPNTLCPGDTKVSCPGEDTCCKLADGTYACCPLKDAVCCSDHIHCCPQGSKCDLKSGKCTQGKISIPWVNKVPGIPQSPVENKAPGKAHPAVASVMCPDGEHECADGNTCCQLLSGRWGCCPFPQAVCCSDHFHCCPNGYTCDFTRSTCDRGQQSQQLIRLQRIP